MLADTDPYIVIAQQEWHLDLGTNARNLAIEFSKSRPVLYVNPPIDIKTSFSECRTTKGRKRLQTALGMKASTVKDGDNLWVHTPATIGLSINWLRNEALFNRLNRLNAKRFYASLAGAIQSLGWKQNRCTVFNDSQMFAGKHLRDYLCPKYSFYYIRDNLVYQNYFKRHGSKAEPETIRRSDAVFANSAYLADYATQYNTKSLDIGQGCELEIYHHPNGTEPGDLSEIPHPRIGYTGFLTAARLDITLLEQIATAKKDYQLILIGPEDELFKQSKLHQMKNVHFLGAKKAESLPNYVQHFDVCINPQVVNGLTVGNYPRKIDEYLAMGKPTVATDTPAMKMFLPHVYLATNLPQYLEAIRMALQPADTKAIESAKIFARSHTWEACVEKIYLTQKAL